MSQVLGVFLAKLFAWQRRRARAYGIADPHAGAMTFVQRFGALLNLNCHAHAVLPDGVFTAGPDGTVQFIRSRHRGTTTSPGCSLRLLA